MKLMILLVLFIIGNIASFPSAFPIRPPPMVKSLEMDIVENCIKRKGMEQQISTIKYEMYYIQCIKSLKDTDCSKWINLVTYSYNICSEDFDECEEDSPEFIIYQCIEECPKCNGVLIN